MSRRFSLVQDEPAVWVVLVLVAAFAFFMPQGACGFSSVDAAVVEAGGESR